MRGRTYDYLRRFNIGDWIMGFNILGDAIDIVMDDHFEHRMTDYYGVLSQKYGRERKRIEDDIRRAIVIAWRQRTDVMERVMMQSLDNPPSARKFIHASADYLNKEETEEMMN